MLHYVMLYYTLQITVTIFGKFNSFFVTETNKFLPKYVDLFTNWSIGAGDDHFLTQTFRGKRAYTHTVISYLTEKVNMKRDN